MTPLLRKTRNGLTFAKYFALNLYFRLLLFIPYRHLKSRIGRLDGDVAPVSTARWIGRQIYRTAQFIPGSTCLSRAMAAQTELKRRGYASLMRIGVANEGNGLRAHAWVVNGETVVVGNEHGELDTLKLLTEMGTSTS